MSLLAAAVPVAVLVLAWDEAAPAVRALVEASETTDPTLDSVVVLVPAAAGELMQEEFLPLAAEPMLPQAASLAESIPEKNAEDEGPNAVPLPPPLALPDLAPAPPAPVDSSDSSVVATSAEVPVKKSTAITAAPAPAWSAVRVLRLSSFSLPELTALSSQALPRPIWQHSVVAPAAPYLGSQLELADNKAQLAADLAPQPEPLVAHSTFSADVAPLPSPTLLAPAQPEQPLPVLPVSAPDYSSTELPLPALDAEADLAPIVPDELAAPAVEAIPATEPTGPAQAGWSEALASLRDPLPIEEPSPATDLEDEATYYAATTGEQVGPAAGAEPTELQPPSKPFEAPNLNFQVIQYARFAVPVALAQLPFGAIYAPAWPTWLAAQELRQRTRQPLVLHVATLAAGEGDSLDTATGWQAELQRQALHRADLILAETPELAHRLRHDLGLPPELVRTVPAADAHAVAQALRTAQLRPSASAS
jgi:hypothetical protein